MAFSSKTREPQRAIAALLPPETLELIFLQTYQEVEVFHDGGETGASTWTLANVCHSWREAAKGSQHLWTDLWVDDDWLYTKEKVTLERFVSPR
jgi:hypothetical protein